MTKKRTASNTASRPVPPSQQAIATAIKQQSTLQEAEGLINGPRREEYGPVQESFRQIAMIASIGIRKHLSPADVCKILLAVKYVRESQGHKRDNLVDLNGYSDLLQQLHHKGVADWNESRDIGIVRD